MPCGRYSRSSGERAVPVRWRIAQSGKEANRGVRHRRESLSARPALWKIQSPKQMPICRAARTTGESAGTVFSLPATSRRGTGRMSPFFRATILP